MDAAIADLTEALALGDDAAIRYNRAVAYQQSQQWRQAVDDFDQALLLDGSDAEDILVRRAACHRLLDQHDEARSDLDAYARPAKLGR